MIAVPSDRLWADPQWVCRQLYETVSTYTAADGAPHLLLGLNTQRWGLGLQLLQPGGFNARVLPTVTGITTAGIELASTKLEWWSVPNHGPLPAQEWYAVCSPGAVLLVVEVIRQS